MKQTAKMKGKQRMKQKRKKEKEEMVEKEVEEDEEATKPFLELGKEVKLTPELERWLANSQLMELKEELRNGGFTTFESVQYFATHPDRSVDSLFSTHQSCSLIFCLQVVEAF